jgi:hypothetical protein
MIPEKKYDNLRTSRDKGRLTLTDTQAVDFRFDQQLM